MKLNLPVIRDMTMKMSVYRFSRVTATMLDSGVPLMTTLRLAAEATDNSRIANAILRACDDIDKGSTIEKALKKHKAFPPFVLDMIGIGEEAGSVSKVLRRISAFYERDVDEMVSNLATVIEPVMTLIMGVIVALIALSLFLPYFNLNQVIGA